MIIFLCYSAQTKGVKMQYKEAQKYVEKSYGDRYVLENGYIRAKDFESANRLLFNSTYGCKNFWENPTEIDMLLLEKAIEKADKLYPTLKLLSNYIDLAEVDIATIENNGNITILFQHIFPSKLNSFPHRRKLVKVTDNMNKYVLGTVIEFTKDNTPIDQMNIIME